ncbi:MAG: thioredoxin family protein [Candidatus Omnitrophica bacterium]|nr:thioredoxin family protein [Candidatus Omnitrophota bacterium]
MKIKVFGKKGCAKCETTKNKFDHFFKKNNCHEMANLEFHDMDTVDGMAEGAYYDALKIPTSVIEKEDKILARWDGEVPKTEEFKAYFEEVLEKV